MESDRPQTNLLPPLTQQELGSWLPPEGQPITHTSMEVKALDQLFTIQKELPNPIEHATSSTVKNTVSRNSESLDLEASSYHQNSDKTEQDSSVPVIEIGLGLGLIAGAVAGIRSLRRARGRSLRRLSDLENHSSAARNILDSHETKMTRGQRDIMGIGNVYPKANDPNFSPETNTTSRFAATHMRRRLENPIEHNTFKPVVPSEARTRTQESSHLRANLRANATRSRVATIDRFRELYGDIVLEDRDKINDYIDGKIDIDGNPTPNGMPLSKSYSKGLRKAARQARRSQRSEGRINSRLARQARGGDRQGLKVRATKKILRD